MPRLAENKLVKKEMTKLASCTKKYKSAVSKYTKSNTKYLKRYDSVLAKDKTPTLKDRKELKKLKDAVKKLSTKVYTIKNDCDENAITLEDMMAEGKVVKEETKIKIQQLFDKLDEEIDEE
jgi:paraquat-inducible protein B